jgi:hypothetical protein
MRQADPMHTSVCYVCYQGTWYAPTAIEVSPRTRDRAAFVTKPESWLYGNKAHEHGKPGAMNLHVIDRSNLAPQFAGYYQSGDRIKVRTTYPSGETWERTGTVGKTTGWRPAYLLMPRITSTASGDVLDANDVVIAVKRGSTYVPTFA